MGKCAFCGNLSNNKKNATLHKFPRDERLCTEWLKLIGLEELSIKSSTFLCSEHFTQDSFVVYYNRKHLKLGTVPTILTKEARVQEQRNVLVKTNYRDKAQDVAKISDKEYYEPRRNVLMEVNCTDNGNVRPRSIIEQVPVASIITDYNDSPSTSKGIHNGNVGPQSIIEQVPVASIITDYNDSPSTSKGILSPEKCFSLPTGQNQTTPLKEKCNTRSVFHDHRYQDTPCSARNKLDNLRRKHKSTMMENKILKQKVGRLRKKVDSLKDVVKELKQQKFLPDSAFYCLSAHEDTSMELFNRMVKNKKN